MGAQLYSETNYCYRGDTATQGSRDAGKVPFSLCSSHLVIWKQNVSVNPVEVNEEGCAIPIHLRTLRLAFKKGNFKEDVLGQSE